MKRWERRRGKGKEKDSHITLEGKLATLVSPEEGPRDEEFSRHEQA